MATLTIKQFSSLSKPEKEDVIFNFGVYLVAYKNLGHLYSLYQLSSFYVEMVYVLKRGKALIKIKVHPTPNTIDRFLDKVNIRGLGL